MNFGLSLDKGFESALPAASYGEAGRGDLVSELKQVIQSTKTEEWKSMSDDCISRARDFSLDAFEKKLKSSL
jgi:hypothetical protein